MATGCSAAPPDTPPKPAPEPTNTTISQPHNDQQPSLSSQIPTLSSDSNDPMTIPTLPTAASSRLSEPPRTSDADVIHIPSHSRWFSWNIIRECEVRHLPEFFDGTSPSRNPKVYKYFRNTIIKRFRENPTKKITFTEIRKTIIGDVGSIRRVFDFLETWGLINYTGSIGSRPQLKWEEKENKANAAAAAAAALQTAIADAAAGNAADSVAPKKRLCNGCKTLCSIACFSCDKYDLTLCARCYVRGNYRVGVNSSDFKRVEISEESKTDWTNKDTLHLLEAVMHYGDDWKKVAEHVSGRTEKECVARFIKLPFAEQFAGAPESAEVGNEVGSQSSLPPTKRKCLSPLADTSNPIMTQAAFLSSLAGAEVAEVAARAALIALSDLNSGETKDTLNVLPLGENQESNIDYNGNNNSTKENAIVEARLQLEKEEEELEKAITAVAVKATEIENKIEHFEEFELETEKRWQQLQQLKNLLFSDQLKLLLQRTASAKVDDSLKENVKVE